MGSKDIRERERKEKRSKEELEKRNKLKNDLREILDEMKAFERLKENPDFLVFKKYMEASKKVIHDRMCEVFMTDKDHKPIGFVPDVEVKTRQRQYLVALDFCELMNERLSKKPQWESDLNKILEAETEEEKSRIEEENKNVTEKENKYI